MIVKTPSMKAISSGHELWTALINEAGLKLSSYDRDIDIKLRRQLGLAVSGDLGELIKSRAISQERVLTAFFAAIEPFSSMYNDILQLMTEIGSSVGNSNLDISFDFDAARNQFKIDIEQFRHQVEVFSRAIQPVTTETWSWNQIWDLVHILEGIPNILSLEAEKWNALYDSGEWPPFDIERPQVADAELDDLLAHGWRFRTAFITACRSFGPRREHLRGSSVNGALTLAGDRIVFTDDLKQILNGIEHDLWPSAVTNGMIAASGYAEDQAYVIATTDRLKRFFRDIQSTKRNMEVLISCILDLLRLPIWKHRYELYSIWVFTQIIKAEGGASKFRFVVENGVFHIPFAPKHLATLLNVDPPVHVYSEVRYAIESARGKSRKQGMQPDYSITIDDRDPPATSFALVECKQYFREARRSFGDAIADYATGQPGASVILANYGPATKGILKYVPKNLHERAFIVGDMRPLEFAAIHRFHQLVSSLVSSNTRYLPVLSSTAAAGHSRLFSEDGPIQELTDNEAHKWFEEQPMDVAILKSLIEEEESVALLAWRRYPQDLDLRLLTPRGIVNYANRGKRDAEPWAGFGEDIRSGQGPEFIVFKIVPPGNYKIVVHNYSDEVPLAASRATVFLHIHGRPLRPITCPDRGEGRWWHVVDIDSSTGELTIVNTISTADP